jgi:hypothetical protein
MRISLLMSARVARRVGIRFGKYTNRERVERKDLWPMSVMPLSARSAGERIGTAPSVH